MFRLYRRLLRRSSQAHGNILAAFKRGTAELQQQGRSIPVGERLDHLDRRAQILFEQATTAGEGDPVPYLLALLDNEDGTMQIMAVQLFAAIAGSMGDHPLKDVLVTKLIQKLYMDAGELSVVANYGVPPHKLLKLSATEALGNLNDRRAVPALIALVDDEHLGLRRSAGRALGAIGDEAGIPAIARLLDDTDVDVRATARDTLERMDTPAARQALEAWRARQSQGR